MTQGRGDAGQWGMRKDEQTRPLWSEQEMDAYAEFTEALARGEEPNLDLHLARFPQYAESLRPDLETALRIHAEVKRFRHRHPDFSIWDLFLNRG